MNREEIYNDINPFLEACDKMTASKFIMIDKRISDVLKSIASSRCVFELIKECMVNFNFDKEWKLATAKAGVLTPSEEPHKFIAFVFSLLNCIDDKKISASDLLSRFYSKTESEAGPYSDFCQSLIVRFKQLVLSRILDDKQQIIEEIKPAIEVNYDKDVLNRLMFLAKDLKDYVQGLKKIKKSTLTKGEILEIINAFYEAVKKQDYSYVKSFVLAIKGSKGKDKEIDCRLVEIMDIVNKTLIDA